ncbi:MAG: HD domain-containing protein, partial [Clostridiales bacterium]|nr:HD domain-containing protein [Clostridiales bacterium]
MKAAPHGGVYADRAVLGDEGEDGARLDDAQADGARVDVGHTVGTGDGPSTVAASPGGYPFFAMLARMKFINRWGLMRNTRGENIQEHSLQVA